MTLVDGNPPNNGRAPHGWSWSWSHLRIDRPGPGYCRVTFDHPPINTITATTVSELAELVTLIEQDPDLNVACDLRFASRENTLLGQFEVATGLVPGGGPMARLSRLVGRGRALEILLVAADLDGPRAEQYGYVNRLIDDDHLDEEVEAIARRLARLHHDTIARTKSYVDSD